MNIHTKRDTLRVAGWVTVMVCILAVSGCVTTAKPAVKAGGLVVAENGKAKAAIVVGVNASVSTRYAAEELQRFLYEMTGASFELITDAEPARPCEIIVGANERLRALNLSVDIINEMGTECYMLLSRGSHIIIAGGEPRGTLYGVYGLLEDHLGCRWFTPAISRIPKSPTLAIEPLDEVNCPGLLYREPFVMDCFDGDWCARNRMNSSTGRLEAKHGGKITYCGFVHTFDQLLPPSKYFDEHPEYYSLIDGKRVKERTQLCCTNDDVVRLVSEEVRKRMRENPDATVFSVSQNDWFNFCKCDKCMALAEAEGSQMGPMLYLVNSVARAVHDEFPDKFIDTLAYQYTRKPPKTMRPEPNVIIRLCSIECDFSHPFEQRATKENAAFCDDLEAWAKSTRMLWVWNYNTSFSNYLVPFPNLLVRGPNIRYMIKNNVRGIFEQDVYTTMNGEFSSLSGYLGAKLLWNPLYDTNRAINEFLEGVYGKAATPIRLYLDMIHDAVKNPKTNMGIWIGPDVKFLTSDVLARADGLFDTAEKAVANDPAVLERVKVARLSVDYVQLERMRTHLADAYEFDHAKNVVQMKPEFSRRVQRFFEVAERNGVTCIRENNGLLAGYKEMILAAVGSDNIKLDSQEAVSGEGIKPGLKFDYYEKAVEQLPDFSTLTPVKSGVAERISLEPAVKLDEMLLRFQGFVRAPQDGVYSFALRSNDGSRLSIGGKVIIDHDGLHKSETKSGFVALRKGWHPLLVEYFESGGSEDLALLWSGPSVKLEPVPAKYFGYRP